VRHRVRAQSDLKKVLSARDRHRIRDNKLTLFGFLTMLAFVGESRHDRVYQSRIGEVRDELFLSRGYAIEIIEEVGGWYLVGRRCAIREIKAKCLNAN
jgi:hypothetical protein